jgi:signal transduction histidine kinase
MPGVGAVSLRVYENSLVRQTEAELAAQGAALAAVAASVWPGAPPPAPLPPPNDPRRYKPEPVTVDLNSTIEPERPPALPAGQPDPAAIAVARRLAPVFDRTSATTLASIVLIDRRGVVVRGRDAGGGYAHLPEVQAALAGQTRTALRRNGDYRPRYRFEWLSRASYLRLHHARPVVVGDGQVVGALLLSRSPRALFRGLYQDRGKILLGSAVIFGLLVVLAGLVSRGVTRPIEALSRASRDVTAGRGVIPETPPTAAIEIRALYEDFRIMAEAIERRSRYLRDVAAAVSHEFKTPLAGITGAVELLGDHADTMTDAERRRFLEAIAADSARLSQLVGRLLDLARADMAQPDAAAAVELRAPVSRAADAHRGPGLRIEVHLPDDLPLVAVPEATLETVLTVLFDNSRQAGATAISVTARAARRAVTLRVADDGPGVPEADRARLFEPFFTSRRAQGGTGLGLPIARSLLAASRAELALARSDVGAAFDLTLPAVAHGSRP